MSLSLLFLALAPTAGFAQQVRTMGEIERLDPAFDALVPRTARIEVLAEGFDWAEGPVWRKDGAYLLFSDVPRNAVTRESSYGPLTCIADSSGELGAHFLASSRRSVE